MKAGGKYIYALHGPLQHHMSASLLGQEIADGQSRLSATNHYSVDLPGHMLPHRLYREFPDMSDLLTVQLTLASNPRA
jgi:hypothetical protein